MIPFNPQNAKHFFENAAKIFVVGGALSGKSLRAIELAHRFHDENPDLELVGIFPGRQDSKFSGLKVAEQQAVRRCRSWREVESSPSTLVGDLKALHQSSIVLIDGLNFFMGQLLHQRRELDAMEESLSIGMQLVEQVAAACFEINTICIFTNSDYSQSAPIGNSQSQLLRMLTSQINLFLAEQCDAVIEQKFGIGTLIHSKKFMKG